jgi:hypothetical protein
LCSLVCPHCLTNKDEENVVIKNACNIFVLLSLPMKPLLDTNVV